MKKKLTVSIIALCLLLVLNALPAYSLALPGTEDEAAYTDAVPEAEATPSPSFVPPESTPTADSILIGEAPEPTPSPSAEASAPAPSAEQPAVTSSPDQIHPESAVATDTADTASITASALSAPNLAPASLVTGNGYTFDPVSGTLTVIKEDLVDWRSDPNVGLDNVVTAILPTNPNWPLEDSFFEDCVNLTSVENLENSIGFKSNNTFRNCQKLASVQLPASPVNFSIGMFSNCTSLTSIALPNDAVLTDFMFYGCTALKTIDNLENAGVFFGISVFENCSSLESVTLHTGAALKYRAFYGCSRLERIGNIESVASFGDDALYGCAFDFTDLSGYPASLTGNLATIAPMQVPKVYFARAGASSASIAASTPYTPAYTIKTRSGGDYAQMVANKASYSSWIDPNITTPTVSASPYDVNVPGVYRIVQSIPSTCYANVNVLPVFTLTVQGTPFVGELTIPSSYIVDTAPLLTAPEVAANYSPITAQGWQIKRTDDADFAGYSPQTPLDNSYNGACLRYFATNAFGTSYSVNTITLRLTQSPGLVGGTTNITTPDAGGAWEFRDTAAAITAITLTHEQGSVYPFLMGDEAPVRSLSYNGQVVGDMSINDQGNTLIHIGASMFSDLPNGQYIFRVDFAYQGETSFVTALFTIARPSALPKPAPKTGEDNALPMWLMLAAGACSAGCLSVLLRTRIHG